MGVLLVFLPFGVLFTLVGWAIIKAATRPWKKPEGVPVARIANPDRTEKLYADLNANVPRFASNIARGVMVLVGIGFMILPWIVGLVLLALRDLSFR